MNEFKVGDKVECLVNGKGEVFRLKSDHDFCIYVSFENGRKDAYTKDGKLYSNSNVCLTHGTWDVKEKPLEITYKVGELVWADLGYGDGWQVFEYHSKTSFHYVVSPQKAQDRRLRAVSNDNIRKFKDNPYV